VTLRIYSLGAAFAVVDMVPLPLSVSDASATRSSSPSHCLPPCKGFACGFRRPCLQCGAGRTFYARLGGAVNYVILIPALLYFISLGLPRRFERAVRVRVTLEMPQRGHSAQTRAGVLLHEQDSEPAEREIREKQLDSAVYIAILLWHSACYRFSARPVEVRPNGAILQKYLAGKMSFTPLHTRRWACL
jgi:hypothetical protein